MRESPRSSELPAIGLFALGCNDHSASFRVGWAGRNYSGSPFSREANRFLRAGLWRAQVPGGWGLVSARVEEVCGAVLAGACGLGRSYARMGAVGGTESWVVAVFAAAAVENAVGRVGLGVAGAVVPQVAANWAEALRSNYFAAFHQDQNAECRFGHGAVAADFGQDWRSLAAAVDTVVRSKGGDGHLGAVGWAETDSVVLAESAWAVDRDYFAGLGRGDDRCYHSADDRGLGGGHGPRLGDSRKRSGYRHHRGGAVVVDHDSNQGVVPGVVDVRDDWHRDPRHDYGHDPRHGHDHGHDPDVVVRDRAGGARDSRVRQGCSTDQTRCHSNRPHRDNRCRRDNRRDQNRLRDGRFVRVDKW